MDRRARTRRLAHLSALGSVLGLIGLGVPQVVLAAGGDPGAGVMAARIDGKGFGHGVGLAQDGALAMGRAGAGTLQILSQFYPGTTLARSGGTVRVAVLTGQGPDAVVSFPGGGQIQDAQSGAQSPGFPLRVPAGADVDLHYDGSHYTATVSSGSGAASAAPSGSSRGPGAGRLTTAGPAAASPLTSSSSSTTSTSTTSTTSPLPTVPPAPGSSTTTTTQPSVGVPSSTTTTTAPKKEPSSTTTTAPSQSGASATSARALWAVPDNSGLTVVQATGRQYRGILQAQPGQATNGGADLDLVNQLDVEQYLMGMGEVQNPSWPLTSLQAQVIVERTYALRAMQSAGELCDDTRCQVYVGVQDEYAAQNNAVSTTRGYVLTYGGQLAATVFSANAGGYTATPEEGFGTSNDGYPYLRSAPYQTEDPDPWSLTVALSDIGNRLGYPGSIASVRVATIGPSTRAMTVVVDGSSGPQTVSGIAFAAALGLRSSMFQLHDIVTASAPPPPPPATSVQALPTDASALSAAAATPVRRSHHRPIAVAARHHATGVGIWGWAALVLVVALAASLGRVAVSRRRTTL